MNSNTLPKKFNFYISYINGIALLFIALIHLIDWSNMSLPLGGQLIKEFFYIGILLFTLTAGSVTVAAYENYSLWHATKRLFYRGGRLLFFYYLYNIVKLIVFNFSTEPFYGTAQSTGQLTISNLLAFYNFSAPITILATLAFLMVLSPLFLYIHKRARYPKSVIVSLIFGLFVINYTTNISATTNLFLQFLYANGYVILPIALWLVPFLIGFFLAKVGFEKQRQKILIGSGVLALFFGTSLFLKGRSLFPSDYQFPLGPYFIMTSIFAMSLLLYIFNYLERQPAVWFKKLLAVLRFLGDNTLYLYLYHWLVIDFTIWVLAPAVGFVWLTVPLFFTTYLLFNRKKLGEYYIRQQVVSTNERS